MFKNHKTLLLMLFFSLLILALFVISSQRKLSDPPSLPQVNSSQNQPTGSSETKSNNEGAVTVEVTPLVLNAGGSPKFKTTFSTHSVELDFDIENIVDLTDDKGSIVDSPRWIGSPPGSHHRSGELDFSGRLGPDVKSVTLTFKNIAGVPDRVFSWNLP